METQLTQVLAAQRPVTLQVSQGFTITNFGYYYVVDLFPDSPVFNPVRAMALGEEITHGGSGKRCIVRPLTPITRKMTNDEQYWTDNILFVHPNDVKGWRNS
jgi:hypothetical protein